MGAFTVRRRTGANDRRVIGRVIGACAALLLLCAGAGAADAAAVRILAFGDSITAGYGLAPPQALPVKLEARLKADGIDAQVINGGVSGDTTAGGLARLDWALQDKPLYAVVELGANDMLRGLAPAQAYANLDKIMARLDVAGVKSLLVGMRAPTNWGRDYQQEFDAIYPELAAKWHVPLYPFLLEDVALDPKLNQGDGLHPNEAGVMVIVGHLAPLLERLVKGGGGQS